jgi:hypothetical protein
MRFRFRFTPSKLPGFATEKGSLVLPGISPERFLASMGKKHSVGRVFRNKLEQAYIVLAKCSNTASSLWKIERRGLPEGGGTLAALLAADGRRQYILFAQRSTRK